MIDVEKQIEEVMGLVCRYGALNYKECDAYYREHQTKADAYAQDQKETFAQIEEKLRTLLSSAQIWEQTQEIEVNDAMAFAFHHALTDGAIGSDDLEEIKIGLCAALANIAHPAPALEAERDKQKFLSAEDYDDLWCFEGMASDGEGYDISRDRMKRLAELGVVRWCGGSRYAITSFGLYVLKAWQHLPLETHEEANARCNSEFKARIDKLNAEAAASQPNGEAA